MEEDMINLHEKDKEYVLNTYNRSDLIITRAENDKINRETVIQYCNVIQGESHAQVFLDREKFDSMVSSCLVNAIF